MRPAHFTSALLVFVGWGIAGACSPPPTDGKTPESTASTGSTSGSTPTTGTTSKGESNDGTGDGQQGDGGATTDTGPSQSGATGGAGDDSGSATDGLALGAYPIEGGALSRGGTMTFTNIGAPGAWPRRLDLPEGDPSCDYKDGTDTWGGHCCMTLHHTDSNRLTPFDQEMTLILKAMVINQLAVYQPTADSDSAPWQRVTAWDARGTSDNLWFTQNGAGSDVFPGDLGENDCVGYLAQHPLVSCGQDVEYYCPDDPGILHRGFSGSKLIVFLGSMDLDDAAVSACDGTGQGHPGPWVALVASELVRDGGRKYNGLCNCYSQTGSVGDGCGEINVFEVVMDDNEYSNREFASTGVRSYQAGHVGGAVCKSDCARDAFSPNDVDVVDACGKKAYQAGPVIETGGNTDGCPVWRRPQGARYFFILLDEATRTVQVGMIHPAAIPSAASSLVPELPFGLERGAIDDLVDLRLPQ